MGMIINPYLVQPSVPAFTGLLDTYSGAAVAYSAARRLSSTYTGALIRVRRSSDNTEQDIGYNGSNVLDETALTTFVGANDGFVTTWYDQSGNTNNASQATAANQPKIVSSGTVIKQAGLGASQPALSFDGVNDFLDLTSLITTANYTSFIAQRRLNSGLSSQWLTQKTSGTGPRPYATILYGGTSTIFMSTYNSTTQILASNNTMNYVLMTGRWGSTQNIYINNSALTTTTSTDANSGTGFDVIGRRASFEYANVYNTEIILYASDKLSDLTGISNNINTFYSIY